MKKISLLLVAPLLLAGCSTSQEITYNKEDIELINILSGGNYINTFHTKDYSTFTCVISVHDDVPYKISITYNTTNAIYSGSNLFYQVVLR